MQQGRRDEDDRHDAILHRRLFEEANSNLFFNVTPLTGKTQGAQYTIYRNKSLMVQVPDTVCTPRTHNGHKAVSTSTSETEREAIIQAEAVHIGPPLCIPNALRRRSDDKIMVDALRDAT